MVGFALHHHGRQVELRALDEGGDDLFAIERVRLRVRRVDERVSDSDAERGEVGEAVGQPAREVVVELRQGSLQHVEDFHSEVGGLAGGARQRVVVRHGQREIAAFARLRADQLGGESGQRARAVLSQIHVLGPRVPEIAFLAAFDVSFHVHRDQIAELGGALRPLPSPQAFADAVYLLRDLLVGDFFHRELDAGGAVVAERHLRSERDGGGYQNGVLHVEPVYLGGSGGVQLALGDGFVGGFVSHAVEDFGQQLLAPQRLLDDAAWGFAPAKSGNGDAGGDALVSPVEIRRQIRVLKLDVERGLVVHNFALSDLQPKNSCPPLQRLYDDCIIA